MKNKILPLFILAGLFSFGQNKLYYIEIPNENNAPKVISSKDGKVIVTHNDKKISDIFSKYEIYKLEQAFPTAKTPYLRKIYLLETRNSDLINELNNYKQYFTYSEETYKGETLLYTPNDYDLVDGVYHHKNYELINLRKAWDFSKGNSNFYIGISDSGVNPAHEDLQNKVTQLSTANDWHGTSVIGIAAAATDNKIGIAGIGFNSKALFKYMYEGEMINTLLILSQNGARVVNASWYKSCDYSAIDQMAIDEIHNNGTVIVVSAGNGGTCGGPDNYVYPASYDHVISVSSVGFAKVGNTACCGPSAGQPFNWEDRLESLPGVATSRHQTNDMVDLRAPGFDVVSLFDPNYQNQGTKYAHIYGTSISAPQVSGVASLMLTANACLNPDEVESILKLTSARLDNIPENQPYLGKLGAGRIDAGNATEIAWQMNPSNGGEVRVEGRSFDKWHFELLNSPEKIIIKNQSFIDNADILFRAKDYILLENDVLLKPGPGKSDYLFVSNNNTCFNFKSTFDPSNIITSKKADVKQEIYNDIQNNDISIYPIPAKENILIKSNIAFSTVEIKIYDGNGRLVQQNISNNKNNIISLNISKLVTGNYILDILFDSKKHYSKKIVKQ